MSIHTLARKRSGFQSAPCEVRAAIARAGQQARALASEDGTTPRALFYYELALIFSRLESGLPAVGTFIQSLWTAASSARNEVPR